MKIEPIYLVAPEPEKPPDRPRTRRAFLAGALFGGLAGGALAWLGPWRTPAVAAGSPSSEALDVDERLRWALDLQEGPLDALVQSNTDFLLVFTDRPDVRGRLTHGVERLGVAVLEEDPIVADQRHLLAAKLAQAIEASPTSSRLRAWLPALRRIRR